MSDLMDRFMPAFDVRETHQVTVAAPAALVYQVACGFSLQSIPLVRTIFALRSRLMGSHGPATWQPLGIVSETQAMGWGPLEEVPGRSYAAGAVCQPWRADVEFRPVEADRFAAFAEAGLVKIAWTIEVEPLEYNRARLVTETRAQATDPAARARFLRYWRWASVGIVLIRWLLLPAIRREAERRFGSIT
ncbi:MAG: hypothetical protein ACHQ2E_08660 [Gemmatimonadales bacterium]